MLVDSIFLPGLPHRQDILGRNISLNVVNRRKDETPPGIRSSNRRFTSSRTCWTLPVPRSAGCLLRHPRRPDPVKLSLQFSCIHSDGTHLHRIQYVHAHLNQVRDERTNKHHNNGKRSWHYSSNEGNQNTLYVSA